MATYVNDLRLKEIATGDESGTWGTSTNTNLELIAEAFSYATQDCFATDADATTTIADGATDPARSLYFKVTSSATLTATRTLTLAPNTVSKVWIIENATTGGQSITISQGSGTNVTIINGSTSVIYSDGGGASANIADAFFNLTLTGDLLVDDSTLYVDSTNNRVGIGTTSPQNQLHVAASSPSIRIEDTDGGYGLVSGLNGNVRLRADEGNTEANSFVGFEIDGTEEMRLTSTGLGIGTTSPTNLLDVENSSGDSVIDVTSGTANLARLNLGDTDGNTRGGLKYDNSNDSMVFRANGSDQMTLTNTGLGIGTSSPDSNLHISSAGGTELHIQEESAGAAATMKLTTTQRAWVVAADANPDIFFINTDAGTQGDGLVIDTSNNVGIGTSSPESILHIDAGDSANLLIKSDGTYNIQLSNKTASNGLRPIDIEAQQLTISTNGAGGSGSTERVIIDDSGKVGIGTSSPAKDLDVSGEIRASTGILFGTDTAAANTLDDYEEGTVTLTFRDESGNTTTGSSGAYTKIGRTVIFTGEEVNVSVTGLVGTDNIQLDLPFTAGGGQTGDSVGATWWQSVSNITNPERTIVMTVGDNGTVSNFQQVYTSGSGVAVKVSDLNAGGTSDLRRFCLVYNV